MKISSRHLFIVLMFLCIPSCATVTDVNRAADLIRQDNEIFRLITETRRADPAKSSMLLKVLAAEAEKSALKAGETSNAVAFYRVAVTAYWRSDDSSVAGKLSAMVEKGKEICKKLGEDKPGRDCLYIDFALPFAALEAAAISRDYDQEIQSINLWDNVDTGKEEQILGSARDYLVQIKPAVENVVSYHQGAGQAVLSSHDEMKQYYCDNGLATLKKYSGIAKALSSKSKSYADKVADGGLKKGDNADQVPTPGETKTIKEFTESVKAINFTCFCGVQADCGE